MFAPNVAELRARPTQDGLVRGSLMLRERARLSAAKDDVGVEVLEEFAHVQVSHFGLTHLVDRGGDERHEGHGERANASAALPLPLGGDGHGEGFAGHRQRDAFGGLEPASVEGDAPVAAPVVHLNHLDALVEARGGTVASKTRAHAIGRRLGVAARGGRGGGAERGPRDRRPGDVGAHASALGDARRDARERPERATQTGGRRHRGTRRGVCAGNGRRAGGRSATWSAPRRASGTRARLR